MDRAFQQARGLFEKPSGSCGALVVHDELRHLARLGIDLDHFGILAADVDDGPGVRVEEMSPHGMARNLGDNFRGDGGEIQRDTAVARPDNVFHRVARPFGRFKQLVQQLVGSGLCVHAGRDDRREKLTVRQEDRLRGAGANVDSNRGDVRKVLNKRRIDDFMLLHCRTTSRVSDRLWPLASRWANSSGAKAPA